MNFQKLSAISALISGVTKFSLLFSSTSLSSVLNPHRLNPISLTVGIFTNGYGAMISFCVEDSRDKVNASDFNQALEVF